MDDNKISGDNTRKELIKEETLMKGSKKVIAGLMAAALVLTGSNTVTNAAGAPTAAKSLTITEGKKKTIKVTGTNIKSKTFKSTDKKIAAVNKKGVVTAKKAGKCSIKVTVKYLKSKKAKKTSTKVLTTKVTIKAAVEPTETAKPTETLTDKERFAKIVEEQKALGATFPDNLDGIIYNGDLDDFLDNNDDVEGCVWTKDGYLRFIFLGNSDYAWDLKGTISFSGFSKLEYLSCSWNGLTNLDVSGCSALKRLYCYINQLTNLDVSGCSALESLYCHKNQLTNLNVSGCSALKNLYCYENQLTNLDISGCSALKSLYCQQNQLTNLNVSGGPALEYLDCSENQLTSLDISGCPKLDMDEVECDKTVTLIGGSAK